MAKSTLDPMVDALTGVSWTRRTRNTAAGHLGRLQGEGGEVGRRIVSISPPGRLARWERWRANLLTDMANSLGCSAVIHTTGIYLRGKRQRHYVTVYGSQSDIDRTLILHERICERALQQVAAMTGTDLTRRRKQHLTHFADMIRTRLGDIAAPHDWLRERGREADIARLTARTVTLHTDTVLGGVEDGRDGSRVAPTGRRAG